MIDQGSEINLDQDLAAEAERMLAGAGGSREQTPAASGEDDLTAQVGTLLSGAAAPPSGDGLDADLAQLTEELLRGEPMSGGGAEAEAAPAEEAKESTAGDSAEPVAADAPVGEPAPREEAAPAAAPSEEERELQAELDRAASKPEPAAPPAPMVAAAAAAASVAAAAAAQPVAAAPKGPGLGARVGNAALGVLAPMSAPLANKPAVRDSIGWVAACTVFSAGTLWAYALVLRKPPAPAGAAAPIVIDDGHAAHGAGGHGAHAEESHAGGGEHGVAGEHAGAAGHAVHGASAAGGHGDAAKITYARRSDAGGGKDAKKDSGHGSSGGHGKKDAKKDAKKSGGH